MTAFDNDSLREAVRLYLRDEYRESVLADHGPMERLGRVRRDGHVRAVFWRRLRADPRPVALGRLQRHRHERMFDATPHVRQDLSKWDVSKVTDMDCMFNTATAFNGDVSTWDVSNVDQHEQHVWQRVVLQRRPEQVGRVQGHRHDAMFYEREGVQLRPELVAHLEPRQNGAMFAGAWHFNSDLQQLGRVERDGPCAECSRGVRVQWRRERLGRAQLLFASSTCLRTRAASTAT